MNTTIDHTRLHRTAKYFMDNGRVQTHAEAMTLLQRFGLTIHVGPEIVSSVSHQVALLTLINAARRTFLGGVEVAGLPECETCTALGSRGSLPDAARALGASVVARAGEAWPCALIGTCASPQNARAAWQLTWQGWRGGVIPAQSGKRLAEDSSNPLSAALSAATCAAELFAWHAGDHAMAGRRCAGLSLWRPDTPWLEDDASEPMLAWLPSQLWLIGLGNLGQAYAWCLGCLPYKNPADVGLLLQDFDHVAYSNDSTSLLSYNQDVGVKKTRMVARWLEVRGFITTLEERRFGEWTLRGPHDPAVALCGVDNAATRAQLAKTGFDLVVETGLGAGTSGFRNFSMHTFPASRTPGEIWSNVNSGVASDVSSMPAYKALEKSGIDVCGLTQLASRTVGVPFVGLIAAAVSIAELLRRLHGASGFEFISGSSHNLEDIEGLRLPFTAYSGGFVSAIES